MQILVTIFGCLLGAIVYLVLALVTPVANWGPYSTAILVALCLIMTSVVGAFPFWRKMP